ncbi:TPA: HK97 family phage prohead protease [Pseudomonas aeruginosa]|uniref:HK97 family phage prohead protease n=1 Tax=Pseudomonas aeruginosa TaxID=287 RepID=UPI002904C1CB|nr:HK97 family phage prohead protease [Pseudomonas aeruginosa]MDU0696307.1 HK97 family phage prohead protease [Pseudomonas aeruginosa]HBN9645873.1 HK97 family phage prohead protease [Pseudomonas aeruginosa]HBN9901132.1 HK97 family phage prohead protease [Pseudomonas aeruginosa]
MNERQKAYAVVTLKDLQQDQRTFKGIASTPETDRHGDIVLSAGARFKNPVPLLWMHEADKAIGTVEFGKPTVDGIPFTARIPKVDEPGLLKDLVDLAWHSVKAKVVRGVSIGFRVLEGGCESLAQGGKRFTSFELMELSLVSVPANPSATITEIKSIGNRIQDPTKLAFADRAQALIKQITEATREAAKGGVKEAYGVAGVGILTGHLIKALERIERLEGDIKVLTELLANVESSR